MTMPIEAVMAKAQQQLQRTGQLDIDSFAAAYPAHAEELRTVLPVMVTLHWEKQWQQVEEASRSFALNLFEQLCPQQQKAPAASHTLGGLFALERAERDLSLEDQARSSGLPVETLERIRNDSTPISKLDNATIKQISHQIAAPFSALLKEIRRLLSVQSLGQSDAGMVFTRDRDLSSQRERKALLEKVRGKDRKPSEGDPD